MPPDGAVTAAAYWLLDARGPQVAWTRCPPCSAGSTSRCQSGDTTLVLTTHDLADIERLCRRLVVIDRGRVVHDGSLDELHLRYGSRRRVVVDLDEPLAAPLSLPGLAVEAEEAGGRRITYALDGNGSTAGDPVRRLAEVAALRDISVVEPDIEDVVARLCTGRIPGSRA